MALITEVQIYEFSLKCKNLRNLQENNSIHFADYTSAYAPQPFYAPRKIMQEIG